MGKPILFLGGWGCLILFVWMHIFLILFITLYFVSVMEFETKRCSCVMCMYATRTHIIHVMEERMVWKKKSDIFYHKCVILKKRESMTLISLLHLYLNTKIDKYKHNSYIFTHTHIFTNWTSAHNKNTHVYI